MVCQLAVSVLRNKKVQCASTSRNAKIIIWSRRMTCRVHHGYLIPSAISSLPQVQCSHSLPHSQCSSILSIQPISGLVQSQPTSGLLQQYSEHTAYLRFKAVTPTAYLRFNAVSTLSTQPTSDSVQSVFWAHSLPQIQCSQYSEHTAYLRFNAVSILSTQPTSGSMQSQPTSGSAQSAFWAYSHTSTSLPNGVQNSHTLTT